MIIANINGIELTESDYLLELSIRSHHRNTNEIDEQEKQDILIQLIDDQLILQFAVMSCFNVSNEEVEESLLNVLLELNNEYDFSEFLKENCIEHNTLMNRVKNQMIIKKFIRETIIDQFNVTDEKLMEVFRENSECFETSQTVRISHILIEGDTEASRQKIAMMADKIKTPADFYQAVKSCSECPTCCQSGDLGYFTQGELIKELDEIVFKMSVNEISSPVKTPYGYHLVLITDIRQKHGPCFEEVKESLTNRLREIDTELKMLRLLRTLRENADIIIFDENLI